MDDFTATMVSGLLVMTSGIARLEKMTDEHLEDFKGQLEVFVSACEYEKELREAAYDAAGGADSRGDKNRAEKI